MPTPTHQPLRLLARADILATTRQAGLIQAVPNTVSIDSLKRKDQEFTTLGDFFERRWGPLGDNTLDVRLLHL